MFVGVLTAWAWGVHRILDGIQLKVPEIDVTKSGVTGCSRLGKAALAAGLFDKRIAVTMLICSGVQGAGPYRYSLSGQGKNLENSVRVLTSFALWVSSNQTNTGHISEIWRRMVDIVRHLPICREIRPASIRRSYHCFCHFASRRGSRAKLWGPIHGLKGHGHGYILGRSKSVV